MRKMILTVLGAALLAGSTATLANAAERHHARHVYHAPATDQFRNANDSVYWPAQPNWSEYSESRIMSGPGR